MAGAETLRVAGIGRQAARELGDDEYLAATDAAAPVRLGSDSNLLRRSGKRAIVDSIGSRSVTWQGHALESDWTGQGETLPESAFPGTSRIWPGGLVEASDLVLGQHVNRHSVYLPLKRSQAVSGQLALEHR
jgi:hypothetical protein